jgi:hypothetical protein
MERLNFRKTNRRISVRRGDLALFADKNGKLFKKEFGKKAELVGSGEIPLSNTAWINQDFEENSAPIFKTYDDAIEWIQENGNPSKENQWQIMLPGGLIPIVTVHEHIKPTGGEGTIIGELRSDVDITLNPIDAMETSYISNVQVIKLNVGHEKILSISNSVIYEIEDNYCMILSNDTTYLNGELSATIFFSLINSTISGIGGIIFLGHLFNVNISRLKPNTKIRNAISDLSFSNVYFFDNFHIQMERDLVIRNSFIDDENEIQLGGHKLTTINCTGNFNVTGTGTWENKGIACNIEFDGTTYTDTISLLTAMKTAIETEA